MTDRTHHDEHGEPEGWDSFARRIGSAETVTDIDVARLRARVRGALPAERHFGWRLFQGAALAASAALAFFAVVDGAKPQDTAKAPAPAVERGDDGSVVIRFADGRQTHRVTESELPQTGAAKETHVAQGRQFVDKNESMQPGTITFYRID
jgi:hypothetical protein